MFYKLLTLGLLLFFTSNYTVLAQTDDSDNGKILFEAKCNKCHAISKPLSKQKDSDGWVKTTKRMSQKTNSDINENEARIIAEYLTSIQTN